MKQEAGNNAVFDTEQAINEVLRAEQDARQRVDACAQEAEGILEQARQAARRIEERGNNRITRVHQHCQVLLSEEIARIEHASQQAAQDESLDRDMAIMNKLLEEIASKLIAPPAGREQHNDDHDV